MVRKLILAIVAAAALTGCGARCDIKYTKNADGTFSVTGGCEFPEHKHEPEKK